MQIKQTTNIFFFIFFFFGLLTPRLYTLCLLAATVSTHVASTGQDQPGHIHAN
jgi:hypothetical protein